MQFLEKEYKHKEILDNIKKNQKIVINKKISKQQDKMTKVEDNLEKQERAEQRMNKRRKQEHHNFNNSKGNSQTSLSLKRAKECIKLNNIRLNRERFKRQEDYKKLKVLIKHAKVMTSRLQKKINTEVKIQNTNFKTNLEMLEVMNSQAKMDSALKNMKLKSKSMQKIIQKADIQDQVIVKRHEEEEQDEFC